MERKKIEVPAEVLTGLEAIRLSGKTNMLDAPRVIELAFEMGHYATALWVHESRKQYAEGVFRGFSASEMETGATAPPNNRNYSRHDAQHGASGQTVDKPSEARTLGDTCEGGENPCVDR